MIIQLHINRIHRRLHDKLVNKMDYSNFVFQIKNGIIEVLPFCILDIIKSFLFYDIKTYETIINTKLNKEKFLYLINNVYISRATNFDDMSDYSDNLEHWAFGFEQNSNEKTSMQAINCYSCGNYILHSGDESLFSDNIYCKCENNDYSSNYSSYNDDNSSDYSLD